MWIQGRPGEQCWKKHYFWFHLHVLKWYYVIQVVENPRRINGKVQSEWPTLADLTLSSPSRPPGVRQSLCPSGPVSVCSAVPQDRAQSRQRRGRGGEVKHERRRKSKDGLSDLICKGWTTGWMGPSVLNSVFQKTYLEMPNFKSDFLLLAVSLSFY